MNTFKTKILYGDFICKVTHYRPYVPAKLSGPMEDAEESIPSEFECTIHNLDGSYNKEMTEYVECNSDESARLQDEYEAAVLADKHGKDF